MKAFVKNILLIYILLLSFILSLSSTAEPSEQSKISRDTNTKNLDFGSYMQHLQRCIQVRWRPANTTGSSQVRTSFYLLPNGSINSSTITIENPQENSEQDIQVARTALEQTSKECAFPLPEGAPPRVKIQFAFTKSTRKSFSNKTSSEKIDKPKSLSLFQQIEKLNSLPLIDDAFIFSGMLFPSEEMLSPRLVEQRTQLSEQFGLCRIVSFAPYKDRPINCSNKLKAILLIAKASKAIEDKEPHKANDLLEEATDLDPLDAGVWYEKANTSFLVKDYNQALNELDQTLILSSCMSNALIRKEVIHSIQSGSAKDENVYAMMKNLLTLREKCEHFLAFQEANRLLINDQKQDALDKYNDALKIYPNFAEALFNRALVYHEMKMYDEAITSANEALDILLKENNIGGIELTKNLIKMLRIERKSQIKATQ
jgi:tetratricopeptide (TPR) repeat protein